MSGSDDRLKRGRIGVAALVVGGGILASRLLGVLREVVFAALLGATGVTDTYVAAFRIPDYANYLLAGGFLTITFIPIFARYLAWRDEEEGWRGFTAILRWLALGVSGLVVAGWVAAPVVLGALYPDFTPAQLAETVRLTRIVIPAQLAFVLGAMFAAVQYAKGYFVVPAFAPVLYNLGIIAGGVGFTVWRGEASPEGFIWGALVGAFAGNFALQLWGARRVGMRLDFSAPWRHPAVRQYVLIALPLMLGQSIVALDETFMSVFGGLVGPGAQTRLLYARRTMLVPVGIIAQAAAVAAYPFLARLFAEGNVAAMRRTVDRALRWVLVLGIGAAGLLAALALPIVRTLFERFAFGPADSAAAAAALFFYAFAVPIWGALQILTRAFYARREMWTPVVVGTGVTVVAIPTYLLLAGGFGIRGVATASVVSLGLYTVALAVLWYRRAESLAGLRSVLAAAGRAIPLAVPAAGAAFGASWLVARLVPSPATVQGLLATLAGTGAFAAVVLGFGSGLHDLLRRPLPAVGDAVGPGGGAATGPGSEVGGGQAGG